MKSTSVNLATCCLCLSSLAYSISIPRINSTKPHILATRIEKPRYINAAGQEFQIQYADAENTTINAWGPGYTTTDIITSAQIMNQSDNPSIPDAEYFEFSQANIEASNQAAFYAVWSIEIQQSASTAATWSTTGEWNLFNQMFLGNKNFLCSFDTLGCHNMLSLHAIRQIYPSRPQARLIYFTLQQFVLFHNTAVAAEAQFSRAQLNLNGYITPMVQAFTRQPEPSRANICRIIKQVIRSSTDVVMGLVAQGIAEMEIPGFEIVFSMDSDIMFEQLWRTIRRIPYESPRFKGWESGGWNNWIAKLEGSGAWAENLPKAKAVTFNPLMAVAVSTPVWIQQAFEQNMDRMKVTLAFDQGYSKDFICGAFRGDEKDRSPQNIVKLAQYLPDILDAARKQMRETFRSITTGRIVVPNAPTAYAMVVMNQKWAGPNSMRSRLEHMEPVKDNIQKTLTKDIISTMLASDGNYVSCGLDPHAQELCKTARDGREVVRKGLPLPHGNLAGDRKLNGATLSYVCPAPSQPNLICQPQRQIQSKLDTQIVEFAGLHSFDNFHPPGNFKISYEEAITEMFHNHLLYRNNITASYDGFGASDVSGVGLRLGFCINEKIRMKDFGGWVLPHEAPNRQWEFPACCGPLCSETQSFLKTIGMEMGGSLWNQREDRDKAPQVYRDRFPRVLERYSPGLRYLAWANAGIRFPDTTLPKPKLYHRRYKFDVGQDKDVELIKAATKDMQTEDEISRWFCHEGRHVHSVFQREWGHVHLASPPMMFIKNSQDACKVWDKKNRN